VAESKTIDILRWNVMNTTDTHDVDTYFLGKFTKIILFRNVHLGSPYNPLELGKQRGVLQECFIMAYPEVDNFNNGSSPSDSTSSTNLSLSSSLTSQISNSRKNRILISGGIAYLTICSKSIPSVHM
jgi:hypothetical protein